MADAFQFSISVGFTQQINKKPECPGHPCRRLPCRSLLINITIHTTSIANASQTFVMGIIYFLG
ncbi:hypothetical protein Mucpa_3486 [Mucilaginibacter paludis DSM 18603]|uniref:Uncharacterized protein n=1 Tax=Mucilaginibacter paludis DSM 18603 TaxID=714943 RepID=H1YIN9_9SPHI|nr:hypothetical protein Mucpa_3486 [Mucilaginibacter paludis DSM 18603]